MKKNLLLIAVAFIGHFVNAQQPAVAIEVQTVTPTTFTVKFTPNEATTQYFILAIDSSQIAWNERLTGKPIHQLIQVFGLPLTTEHTYTWKDFQPGVKYFVYALANDSTNPVHQRATVITPIPGGTGVAVQTVEVSEVTETSAKVVTIPNAETRRYYENIFEAGMLDTLSIDSIASIIIEANQHYARYAEYSWTWGNLTPNSEYIALSVGFNINNERGTITTAPFRTLVSSLETTNSNISLATFPNPALETLIVRCDDMTKIELFDLAGRQLLTKNVSDNNTIINVTNYEAGTYVLRVTTKQGIASTKVVVGIVK